MVPRPLVLHVEHQAIDGERHITIFEKGLARLAAHEIDHIPRRFCLPVINPGHGPDCARLRGLLACPGEGLVRAWVRPGLVVAG